MDLDRYHYIQNISKQVLQDMVSFIQPGVTEQAIHQRCVQLFAQAGITESWYHGVIALVFVGDRTTLSMSGRDYQPTNTVVKDQDLVTIDVSPMYQGCWSDYARSFIVGEPNTALQQGVATENTLHEYLQVTAKPDLTFAELNKITQAKIQELGYKNLDFKGNLGHTINHHINERIYIEPGETTKLSEIELFTFEPHIQSLVDGHYGFRREDIYYFESEQLKRL